MVKYKICWGKSVYYKHQKKATKCKVFQKKRIAESFLKELNKRKSVDFITAYKWKKNKWDILG